MLRVFSDRRCVPPGVEHTVMLYPFWGNPAAPIPDPVSGDYARYMAAAPEFLQLTSLDAADVAVLPFAWEQAVDNEHARDAAAAFVRDAEQSGVPAAVFFFSDSDDAVPLQGTVFRTSLARGSRTAREFALPAWNEDIVARYCAGRLPVRARPAVPTVGFCGRVPRRGRARTLLARLAGRTAPDHDTLRASAIDAIVRSRDVTSRVVERGFFFGDGAASATPEAEHRHAEWRRQFVDNMLASDYALCIRGAGNYSFRLYEALCCGRIPVVVDTDCVLPYDWEIDWRAYGVWVGPNDLAEIGDRVAAFNASVSDGAFIELQHACRRLWEDRLSPEGFFRHFHRHFPCVASRA